MRMVHEVSKLIGVSKRTLQYYNEIGLLSPTEYTESGYRLYDDVAVEKLWKILLLRELGYQLKDIKKIFDDPDFDLRESIGKHIKVLTKKKERLENLIGYASIIKMTGIAPFNFEEYGDITFDEFIENSKKIWNMNMFAENANEINNPFNYELMQMVQRMVEKRFNKPENVWNEDEIEEIEKIAEDIFSVVDCDKVLAFQECIDEFTNLIDKDVYSEEAQVHVKKLYDYINNLFGCSMSLNGFSMYGQIFASGGDYGVMNTKNLGEETTDFIAKAIQVYCDRFMAEQK